MKILNQKKLIELYRGYFEFKGMKWPDDPRDALDFVVTEVGEIFDALKRQQSEWVRHNKKEGDLGMEISQAIMMLVIAAEQAEIDVQDATYRWMREKDYEGEYWAGKDYVIWAYPTDQSEHIHLWGKFDGLTQSACGLEMPRGHDFSARLRMSARYPRG
ncbi:MAG: hypothetical protein KAI64_06210, partial [Thermoplasmata archaeon]|nr:hypothetical protein [Thermoplasmata archaeon]